ncbi:type II secretion system protein F [Rothia kristinae]|uniref:Type II secretion system protein F n=1 Tax=Rothia kristinae TaxID=37923 RepID=A0A1S2N147_9MICC|nr:type II secretion system F family protein [Rothia kristinae]OIJ36454.1 type II secretion system protein F [Rothia kristinae]
MSAAVGLLLGIGLLLVWSACWTRPTTARSRPVRTSRILVALRHAGVDRVSVRGFVGLCAASCAVCALGALALTQIYALGACAAVLGAWAPWGLVSWQARQRDARVRRLWPDVVDHLRSAIRAGLSLPEAMIQLQYRGPEQLKPAFAAFATDYRATGDFNGCINRFKERMSDPIADNIVEALRVTREVGGTDLGRLLSTLAGFLRENSRTRAELEARQSWTVNAARLAIAAPWIVLLLMATQPAALQAYNSLTGYVVMLGGAGISVLAYRLMLRIGALPPERRVLR